MVSKLSFIPLLTYLKARLLSGLNYRIYFLFFLIKSTRIQFHLARYFNCIVGVFFCRRRPNGCWQCISFQELVKMNSVSNTSNSMFNYLIYIKCIRNIFLVLLLKHKYGFTICLSRGILRYMHVKRYTSLYVCQEVHFVICTSRDTLRFMCVKRYMSLHVCQKVPSLYVNQDVYFTKCEWRGTQWNFSSFIICVCISNSSA